MEDTERRHSKKWKKKENKKHPYRKARKIFNTAERRCEDEKT